MPKFLPEAAIRQFNDHGYYSPVSIFDAAETTRYRAALAAFEAHEGGRLTGAVRNKSHLFLRWLHEVATAPRLLDAVEDLIGPNILLYHAQWFIKEPMTPDFVSMHQDSAYWSLSAPQGLSAWVAFEVADGESGCMTVIPDSHARALPHADRRAATNMLWRGQTVAAPIDQGAAVEMPLQPGQVSFHHARIVHGSGPNRSGHRRIGYSLRYIPTHIARTGPRDSAMLVRGVDRYGHFDLEPPPTGDWEPDALARHAEVNRRFMENYTTAPTEAEARGAA